MSSNYFATLGKVSIIRILHFNASSGYGFPGSSAGTESTCNAGGPGLIPGSGRSPGEGVGYRLQYLWASLVAQMVKNPRALQEIWVQSPCQEDLLEKEMATHSSVLALRIPGMGEPGGLPSMGSHRVGHNCSDLAAAATVQFSRSGVCLTLCDPMNCSTPGLPVHHQLSEFTQTHVH